MRTGYASRFPIYPIIPHINSISLVSNCLVLFNTKLLQKSLIANEWKYYIKNR